MRVLSAAEHRAVDQATLREHGIDSVQLMERAATAWTRRFTELYTDQDQPIAIVCGSGNNGGDGLVAARILRMQGYTVSAILARIGGQASPDNRHNQRRARDVGVSLRELKEGDGLPEFRQGGIIVDALFGTGLSRPVEGYWARLIEHMNAASAHRVAIDLPSGLVADGPSSGSIVRADRTLSLGYPKLALFSPANTHYLGTWELVAFDLAKPPAAAAAAGRYLLRRSDVADLRKPRRANDHKGTFGHALLVAGSFGKMGAAIICARAVLRSGAGLLTCHIPRVGYEIMQISLPEAMCLIDDHRYEFTRLAAGMEKYDAVGVGPGIGQEASTRKGLFGLLDSYKKPLVIDADALNILASEPERLRQLPRGSMLTPHPKEFARLFGEAEDDFARWRVLRERSQQLGLVILLKTGNTAIATPAGELFFNTTGNPGMATGGTGDALTGLLTGLLAQGYPPEEAAKLGVYLHGLAGDLAAERIGQEAMLAGDLVEAIGPGFQLLSY